MEADALTIFDVEHSLLTGRVVDRQRDEDRREWKYLVRGKTIEGDTAVTVARIGAGGTLVIITVYVDPAREADDEV